MSYSEHELSLLARRELQNIAKDIGVKANQKSSKIIEQILEVQNSNSSDDAMVHDKQETVQPQDTSVDVPMDNMDKLDNEEEESSTNAQQTNDCTNKDVQQDLSVSVETNSPTLPGQNDTTDQTCFTATNTDTTNNLDTDLTTKGQEDQIEQDNKSVLVDSIEQERPVSTSDTIVLDHQSAADIEMDGIDTKTHQTDIKYDETPHENAMNTEEDKQTTDNQVQISDSLNTTIDENEVPVESPTIRTNNSICGTEKIESTKQHRNKTSVVKPNKKHMHSNIQRKRPAFTTPEQSPCARSAGHARRKFDLKESLSRKVSWRMKKGSVPMLDPKFSSFSASALNSAKVVGVATTGRSTPLAESAMKKRRKALGGVSLNCRRPIMGKNLNSNLKQVQSKIQHHSAITEDL